MPQLTNLTATTETEAVNTMLAAIGEAPVSNPDNTTQPDAAIAFGILRELCREVLTEGWRFNTRYNVVLSPSASLTLNNGQPAWEFEPPLGMIRFEATPNVAVMPSFGEALFHDLDSDKPYFLTPTLTLLRLVSFIGWTFLPETARQYILKLAVNRFLETLGTREQVYFSVEDVERSRRLLDRDQRDTRRFNIFRGSEYFDVMGGRS
jgi:hypothetical protein